MVSILWYFCGADIFDLFFNHIKNERYMNTCKIEVMYRKNVLLWKKKKTNKMHFRLTPLAINDLILHHTPNMVLFLISLQINCNEFLEWYAHVWSHRALITYQMANLTASGARAPINNRPDRAPRVRTFSSSSMLILFALSGHGHMPCKRILNASIGQFNSHHHRQSNHKPQQ